MFNTFKQKFTQHLEQRGLKFTLDEDSKVLLLGRITIVLGNLSDCSGRESAMEAVDEMLETVLARRKGYHSAQASDMYLLMVGPTGSCNQSNWRTIAAEIERDDRLARKHLWLPGAGCLDASFQSFIQTTFLANLGLSAEGQTDALSLLNSDIGLPSGWENILLNPDLTGADLVSELMLLEAVEE